MYTVKIDNRGKILIPKEIRDKMKINAGQKMTIKISSDNIQIIPYTYICKDCGANILDGDINGFCQACLRKRTKKVY